MRKIGLASTFLLLSATTIAQESSTPFSISAFAGAGHHKIDSSGGYEDESGTDFSPSIAINYHFTPSVKASIAYTNYGEVDLFDMNAMEVIDGNEIYYSATVQSSTTAISAYATYSSDRVVKGWSYSASLGLAKWNTDIDFDIDLLNFDASSKFNATSEDGIALIGGVGASYAVTESIDINLQANWFVNDLDIDLIANETIDMQHGHYGVGVTFKF